MGQHTRSVVAGFTAQAESFNTSAVATDEDLLDRITVLAAPRGEERWLEAACGPGLIARRLAPHVAHVHGFDLTPAMIEVARREAAAAELTNAEFSIGDATALQVSAAGFDGAVARFAVHHIPVPGRLLEELSRVLRPEGKLVLVDLIADDDPEARAWSQEIERLRDPTHWATLSLGQLRSLATRTGLRIEEEQIQPLELDFDDWLVRGGTGDDEQILVERLLGERPAHSECFTVTRSGGQRVLRLRLWLARLRR